MKHSVQHLLAMAIAVGISLTGVNAYAATSTTNSSLVFNPQGIATLSGSTAAGTTAFNNLYTFTTTASSGGASSIASFNGTSFSTAFSAFNLLDVTNSNAVLASGSIGPSFVAQLSFSGLNSYTTYGLNVIGTVTNPSAGSFYSGSLSVSPVPEPGEYLLLLCGLGLVGFTVMKRSYMAGIHAA